MNDPAGLRERLLDHATAMLEAGEAEPGIRAVARAAGVSAMAPYRHFADKAALLRAVAARGSDLLLAALSAADARGGSTGDGDAALVEQGVAYVTFALRHPALFRLMFGRACAPPLDDAGGPFAILSRRVAAVAGGASPDAALGCWAIVHGLATLALDGGIAPAPGQVRAVLAMHVAGITRRAEWRRCVPRA
jgi:AcrR family transcriptional regulator